MVVLFVVALMKGALGVGRCWLRIVMGMFAFSGLGFGSSWMTAASASGSAASPLFNHGFEAHLHCIILLCHLLHFVGYMYVGVVLWPEVR